MDMLYHLTLYYITRRRTSLLIHLRYCLFLLLVPLLHLLLPNNQFRSRAHYLPALYFRKKDEDQDEGSARAPFPHPSPTFKFCCTSRFSGLKVPDPFIQCRGVASSIILALGESDAAK